MEDQNNNGIPDDVEIKTHEADAAKARADAEKAKLDLERARLPYQVPLYDRIVMRFAIPFCLAFAAPIATYYFGAKASSGLEAVERLEKTAERLERLVVESELRERMRAPTASVASVQSSRQADIPLGETSAVSSADQQIDQIAKEYLDQVQQEPDLDKFLRDRDQSQRQVQTQQERR